MNRKRVHGNTLIVAEAPLVLPSGPAQVLAEAWQAAAGHHLCQLAVSGSGTAVIALAVSPVSKLRQLPASVVPARPAGAD